MDRHQEEIENCLQMAYLRWQQDRKLVLQRFSHSLQRWLYENVPQLPFDWRPSWKAFVADWQANGVDVVDETNTRFIAWMEEREREALTARAQAGGRKPSLAVATRISESQSEREAPSSLKKSVVELAQLSEPRSQPANQGARPAAESAIVADSVQARDRKIDEYDYLRRYLNPNFKQSYTGSDVNLALNIARAIRARSRRIKELDAIPPSTRVFTEAGPVQVPRSQDLDTERKRLGEEIEQLKRSFSNAGLDNIQLSGTFGPDAQHRAGRGLDGAWQIVLGQEHHRSTGMPSVAIDDFMTVAALEGLLRAAAVRSAKAAVGTIGKRLGIGAEREAANVLVVMPRATELKLSDTVQNQLAEVVKTGSYKGELANPYTNSRLLMQEIMDAKPPVPDPEGVAGVLRWEVSGTFRTSSGTWELVINPRTKTVLHFKFTTR